MTEKCELCSSPARPGDILCPSCSKTFDPSATHFEATALDAMERNMLAGARLHRMKVQLPPPSDGSWELLRGLERAKVLGRRAEKIAAMRGGEDA